MRRINNNSSLQVDRVGPGPSVYFSLVKETLTEGTLPLTNLHHGRTVDKREYWIQKRNQVSPDRTWRHTTVQCTVRSLLERRCMLRRSTQYKLIIQSCNVLHNMLAQAPEILQTLLW